MFDKSEIYHRDGVAFRIRCVGYPCDGLPTWLEELYDGVSERSFDALISGITEENEPISIISELRFSSEDLFICAKRELKAFKRSKLVFHRIRSEIWDIKHKIMLTSGEKIEKFLPENIKKDIKKLARSTFGGLFFDGNNIFVFQNSSSNARIIQKIKKKEQFVKMQ